MATSPIDKTAPPLSEILRADGDAPVIGGATKEGLAEITKLGDLLGSERPKDLSDEDDDEEETDEEDEEFEENDSGDGIPPMYTGARPHGDMNIEAATRMFSSSSARDSTGMYSSKPTVMFPSRDSFDIWCRENSLEEEAVNKLLYLRHQSLGDSVVLPLDSVTLATLSLKTSEAAREEREKVAEEVRLVSGQLSSLAREVGTIASLTEAVQALAGAADRDIRWQQERFDMITVFLQFMSVEESPAPLRWGPLLWEVDYGKLAAALAEFDDVEDKERVLASYMAAAKVSLEKKKMM
uniref:Tegument protein n=1 Tax=Soybean cyst nematode associated northern cereal mosaic virus TaxID=1034378 RepID=G0WXQ3_9RHAB|nr:hypothetical protein [Soybean cyst nematode associated northern cereal mosaic virus]